MSRLKEQLTSYHDSKTGENAEAEESDRYYHGDQWTKEQIATLNDRRQPVVTFNRIVRKVNTIVGILEKVRQDPKAYPNKPTPGAEDGSELATKVIRNLIGWDWQNRTVQLARRGAVRAIAGTELIIEEAEDGGNPSISLEDVDQRDFFYDPRSQKLDFSDCRFMGKESWKPIDEVEFAWPEAAEALRGFVERAPYSIDKSDSRYRNAWYNKAERQVRVIDHWYKRGETWFYCIYVGDVILDEGESPHRTEKKKSDHKFRMYSCDIDQQGDRYSFVRNLKGPQDALNSRHSKALHALNTRRIEAQKGAFDDPDKARREAARSDGYLERNPGFEAEVVTNDMDVQGNLEMMKDAQNEIDSYGPNPALIGTTIDAASGKAIALLQAAGIAELGNYIIAFKHWKLSVYRQLWCAAQQFWTAEQWIRETDQEGMAQFVQINGWEKDEWGFPVLINQLSQLDVDIVIDEGADTTTAMEDTFDIILDAVAKGMQVPPAVIIKLSRLPSSVKKEVMAMIEAGAQPNPMDMQALQLKLQEVMASIQKTQGQAQLAFAQAEQVAAETMRGPEGSPAQVDTPADLAKARLDMAKADEIQHRIAGGQDKPPSMFDVYEQQARTAKTNAEAQRAGIEAQNLAVHGTTEPAKLAAQREAAEMKAKADAARPKPKPAPAR